MTTSILNAMLLNAVFKGALLNVIQHEHRSLWFGMRERIMDDRSCHEFWIIWIATGTSVKYWCMKSLFSFKAFLVLSFNKVLIAYMLQVKLTFRQEGSYSFFRDLCIRWYISYWKCGGFHWLASRCRFYYPFIASTGKLSARIQKIKCFSSNRHSKSVWPHTTSYSNIYCNTWWPNTYFGYLIVFFSFCKCLWIFVYANINRLHIKLNEILIIPSCYCNCHKHGCICLSDL